jgi:F0F1-type ATP synthase assembly protein I
MFFFYRFVGFCYFFRKSRFKAQTSYFKENLKFINTKFVFIFVDTCFEKFIFSL